MGYQQRSGLSFGKRFDPRLPIQKNPSTERNFPTNLPEGFHDVLAIMGEALHDHCLKKPQEELA
jgi:hypothetical protein